jgi:hypothetical protein
MIIQPTRRSLITGLASLIASPVIVHAENLMILRGVNIDPWGWALSGASGALYNSAVNLFSYPAFYKTHPEDYVRMRQSELEKLPPSYAYLAYDERVLWESAERGVITSVCSSRD